jgi:hypothetical protein
MIEIFTASETRPEVWDEKGKVCSYGQKGQQPKVGDIIQTRTGPVEVLKIGKVKSSNVIGYALAMWHEIETK